MANVVEREKVVAADFGDTIVGTSVGRKIGKILQKKFYYQKKILAYTRSGFKPKNERKFLIFPFLVEKMFSLSKKKIFSLHKKWF